MATARHPAAIARRQEVVLSEQVARNTVVSHSRIPVLGEVFDPDGQWRRPR